ncbi:MAG: hypothetical protein Faunusvirus23_5 [Faunusvirus sp.]|jgi:ankyrin repeat protein|uniref:Uncharacterized protein n=1 Tax=Faunusvirus sp. TaxID=2487766 RepID=A0A3G4ZXC5_9VIRU|nr:MAG: hypothetical protein Faunusvirus23_5 [Faunusvirus sp.]
MSDISKNTIAKFEQACRRNDIVEVADYLKTFDINYNFGPSDKSYTKKFNFTKVTPLALACTHNCYELAKLLLTYDNIDVNLYSEYMHNSVQGNFREHVIEQLIQFKHYGIAALLLQHPKTDITEAQLAIFKDCYKSFKSTQYNLLELLNAHPNFDGGKALISMFGGYSACYNCDVVKILLSRDIDVNMRNADGDTALMSALEHSSTSVAMILLNSPKIDLFNKNIYDDMAIDYAKKYLKKHAIGNIIAKRMNDISRNAFVKLFDDKTTTCGRSRLTSPDILKMIFAFL